jgi:hypothetical protein
MALTTFTIKQNDRLPNLRATLNNATGVLDLSTASSVKLLMRGPLPAQTVKVNAACTVTDAVNGVVTYEWAAADTDTSGLYQAEFQVTWPGTKYQTIPNSNYFDVLVVDDISD